MGGREREREDLSVLKKIAYLQDKKDEAPNQELAKELIETNNVDGIREIA